MGTSDAVTLMENHLVCSYKGLYACDLQFPNDLVTYSQACMRNIYDNTMRHGSSAFMIGSQVLHRQNSMPSPNLPCRMRVWREKTARFRLWCCNVTEWPQELDLRAQRNSQGMTMEKKQSELHNDPGRESTPGSDSRAGVTTGEGGRWGFPEFSIKVQKVGARILKKKEKSLKQDLWAHSEGRACENPWSQRSLNIHT